MRRIAAVGPVVVMPPLLVLAADPAGYSPFGPSKHLVVGVCALGGLAALVGTGRGLRGDRRAGWCWLALLAWLALAAMVGVDRFHGLVGLPERRLGWVTWLLFAVWFVIGQSLDSVERRWLVRGCALAGLLSGVWAALDGLGHPLVASASSSERLTGAFGSAAYLGAACALLVPLCAGVALDRSEQRGWRIVGGTGAFLGLMAAVGSGTRAAWIGLLGGSVFAARALGSGRRAGAAGAASTLTGTDPATRRARSCRPVSRQILLAMAVGGAVAIAAGGWLLPHSESPSAAMGRAHASGRLDEWSLGARTLATRPLLGAGPEGYRIVNGTQVTRAYERTYGRAVLPDRSHNGLLDVGLAGGVPALILYAGLLVLVVHRAWQVARRAEPAFMGVAVGLVAYVIQQQFLFPLVEVDPIFWVLAGTLVAAARPPRPWSVQLPRAVAAVPTVALVAVAILGGRELAADRHVRVAVDRLAAGDVSGAVADARAAAALRPDVLRVGLAVARAEAAAGTVDGAERGLAALDRALGWSPRDPVVRRVRAELLTSIAEASGDPEAARRALEAWRRLAEDDPNNAAVQLGLGVAAAETGDSTSAEAAWRDAADLAPESVAPLINLARLLAADGRADDARAALDDAERRAPGDPDVVRLREELADG